MVTSKEHPELSSIERDWRAGVMSNRDIAAKYNTSESNVRRYALKHGWVKDNLHKAGMRALVKAGHVKNEYTGSHPDHDRPPPEMEGIEIDMAEAAEAVVLSHRRDLTRMRNITRRFAEELHEQMTGLPEIEEKIIEYFSARAALDPLQAGIHKQQMQRALHALGLNARSKTLVNVVQSMQKLVEMERIAVGLDDKNDGKEVPYEEGIAELARIAEEKRQQQTLN